MQMYLKKNEATEIVFPMITTASPETFDTGETVTDIYPDPIDFDGFVSF